jgi:hypothetical protein
MAITASNNPTECSPVILTRFIGEFASLFALQSAYPTAASGSYAIINQAGTDVTYYYSVADAVWFALSGSDQNNLDLFVNIYANISLSSQAQLAYINTQTFVVGETQTLWMRIIQFEVIDGFDEIRVVALYKHILGKGTYGNTGTAISYSNLEFITTYIPTAADYQNAPTTETIVIEDLGGLNVAQFVNAKNPFYVVKAISEGRTLFATPAGIYLFKLAGGNYGVNGISTTTLADYELLSETATPPTIDAEVLQNSTNAVSGGGVFNFVQPILEKEVPIITDSFTILDSEDSKRKKFTFDNLINYVKVFIDDSLALFKTVNFLDLTSSAQTQIDSKQVKDSQIEVNGSTNVSNAWNGKTILVTASCTITIPATLLTQFMFVGRTLAGVTLTIAITAPFTFETAPTTITGKKTFSLIRRGNTNTILLDF